MTETVSVLLVEDEKLIGTLVRINLEHEGFRVDWYRDAESALEDVMSARHDLLVLDISLPGISGLDLLRKARQAGVRTPVVILTAHSQVDIKVQGLDLGADDYVTKPFDVTEFVARVRAIARRAGDPARDGNGR